jgi:hypothetical protein
MVNPEHKRRTVREVADAGLCSLRRACRFLRLGRSSLLFLPKRQSSYEESLLERLRALSKAHPTYATATASSRPCSSAGLAGQTGLPLPARLRPEGKAPEMRQPTKRFKSSLLSAVNNQGKMQWMALKSALDADIFIGFLKRLIKHRKRKIFLIVDNLRAQHSKPVKEWVEKNKHRLELVYMPSYSPELDPDESLKSYLKRTLTHGGPSST